METQVQQVSNSVEAALQKEAESNKIFNLVCKNFKNRERDRRSVTVKALKASLAKETDILYPTKEFNKVFKILGDLHLGTLIYDKKGNLESISKLHYPLKEIGRIALINEAKPNPTKIVLRKEIKPPIDFYTVKLIITIDDNEVPFPEVIKIPPGDLGRFMVEYNLLAQKLNIK